MPPKKAAATTETPARVTRSRARTVETMAAQEEDTRPARASASRVKTSVEEVAATATTTAAASRRKKDDDAEDKAPKRKNPVTSASVKRGKKATGEVKESTATPDIDGEKPAVVKRGKKATSEVKEVTAVQDEERAEVVPAPAKRGKRAATASNVGKATSEPVAARRGKGDMMPSKDEEVKTAPSRRGVRKVVSPPPADVNRTPVRRVTHKTATPKRDAEPTVSPREEEDGIATPASGSDDQPETRDETDTDTRPDDTPSDRVDGVVTESLLTPIDSVHDMYEGDITGFTTLDDIDNSEVELSVSLGASSPIRALRAFAIPEDGRPGCSCLVIGDPHFKINNVVEIREMIAATVKLARARRPTFIVCLGDILDTHSRIDQVPLNLATQWLFELSRVAPLFIVVGNHDRMSDEDFLTDQHPFTALKFCEAITVVDRGAVLDVCDSTGVASRFVFVPYVYRGRLDEALTLTCAEYEREEVGPPSTGEMRVWQMLNLPDEEERGAPGDAQALERVLRDTTAVFAHQEFRDAKMGPFTSKHGDEWPEWRPLVVSGHIHDYDRLRHNILYTGTPFQHAYGDRADKTVSWMEVVPTRQLVQPGEVPLAGTHTLSEERVHLGVRRLVQIRTEATDFETYTPRVDPNKVVLSWVVRGTRAEIAALRRSPKWMEWKPWIVVQIVPDAPIQQKLPSDDVETDGNTSAPSISTAVPFMIALYQQAELIPGVKEVYEEIFNPGGSDEGNEVSVGGE